jgi:hypothetical protein
MTGAPTDPMIEQIGENIDQLVTLDVMSYGVIGPLYRAGRARQGGRPLCLQAAERLRHAVSPGRGVILTTGLIIPGHHPYGETDGPIGTAVLARGLAYGLAARVLVMTEAELVSMNAALLRAAGLQVIAPEALAGENGRHRPVAAVIALPRDTDAAETLSRRWLTAIDAAAVIAIEKAGANRLGVYHMVGGADISASVAKGHALFAAARAHGALTIGIGDRGNELGMGNVAAAVQDLLPFGRDCGCPCHGGVADETPADLAIPAVISNWGAYGVVACLAALLELPALIQDAAQESELFATAQRNGGVDGMSGRAERAADGVPEAVHRGLVRLIAEIYRAQSARDPSPFSTPLIRRRAPPNEATT